uniref:Uncharacterized protein n=1 Tax=Oryza glumipatula TaxID=40148 RepID=A0A0E0ALG2_9ORYZ
MASPSASSPRVPLTDEERKAPLLPTPPSPTKLTTAVEEAEKWAYGQRFAQHHWGRASGMVTTLIPTPGKGKFERGTQVGPTCQDAMSISLPSSSLSSLLLTRRHEEGSAATVAGGGDGSMAAEKQRTGS